MNKQICTIPMQIKNDREGQEKEFDLHFSVTTVLILIVALSFNSILNFVVNKPWVKIYRN